MATLAQIQAKATTPLTSLELEKVREIIGFEKGQVNSLIELVDDLSEEERQATRADIDDFDSIPSGAGTTAKLGGSGTGLEYDGVKDREAIANRLRLRLGIPIASQPASGSIYGIAIPLTCFETVE